VVPARCARGQVQRGKLAVYINPSAGAAGMDAVLREKVDGVLAALGMSDVERAWVCLERAGRALELWSFVRRGGRDEEVLLAAAFRRTRFPPG